MLDVILELDHEKTYFALRCRKSIAVVSWNGCGRKPLCLQSPAFEGS